MKTKTNKIIEEKVKEKIVDNGPETSITPDSVTEVQTLFKVAPLQLVFNQEDMNKVVAKLNEIIDFLNK